MSATIQVVCFDWGGVILEICASWREAFARVGLQVPAEPVHEATRTVWRDLGLALHRGEIDEWSYCQRLAATIGANPHHVLAAHHAYLKAEYPGMAQLVEEVHAATRVTTGLLSNTSPLHYACQLPGPDGAPARFPIAARLHHRVASHLIGCAKPEPAMYAAFERVVGCRGTSILFFDDMADNVEAARRRGWQAVHIDPQAGPARQVRAALVRHGVLPA